MNIVDKQSESTEQQVWTPPAAMTNEEFQVLGRFIQAGFGIKMPPTKKTMLQSRLTRRLREMNMLSYRQYQKYLFSPEGLEQEVPLLVDAVTTNKTDFFRERSHFELLQESLLPAWMKKNAGRWPFIAWSAGCATGEETYTLAMVLAEFVRTQPGFDFSILGTDVSQAALQKAREAIYTEKRAEDIPRQLQKKYLMRSRDRQKKLVRFVPEIRQKVSFHPLNFMEAFSCPGEKKDAIFCRNVIIYFERPVQETLFQKCCRCLKPGGYLFIGHSETLSGMNLPLQQIRPTVYQKI